MSDGVIGALLTAVASIDWKKIGEISSALLTPVIGATTTYIAYRQWRTDHDRLRVELYDRRAGVLRATKKLLATATAAGDLTMGQVEDFAAATSEAGYLIDDKKITALLKEITKRAIAVSTRHDTMSRMMPGPELAQMAERHGADLIWMSEQLELLHERFGKYLAVA